MSLLSRAIADPPPAAAARAAMHHADLAGLSPDADPLGVQIDHFIAVIRRAARSGAQETVFQGEPQ